MNKRISRVNSLLKEVISEVIKRDVRNPRVNTLITITNVEISNDLHHARVFISVIGTEIDKKETLIALESAAGFISVQASKKVTLRYFPQLTFKLDASVDAHGRIDCLLEQIHNEQQSRNQTS